MAQEDKSAKAKDVLSVIDKLYASTKDIQLLANCGKNNALKIKNEIREKLESEGYYLPSNTIPMDQLVEFLNINIKYLKEVNQDA